MSDIFKDYFVSRNWLTTKDTEYFWYYDALCKQHTIRENARVLEIGFGDYRFLDWCKTRGLEPTIKKDRSLDYEAILGPLSDTGQSKARQFKLIVAFDEVGHLKVTDIRDLLHTLVSPDALKCISTLLGLFVEDFFNDRFLPLGTKSRIRRGMVKLVREFTEAIVNFAYFGLRLLIGLNLYIALRRQPVS